MRISHKHKFVFIAVMKTGSTSVRNTLNDYSDIISNSDKNSPYTHHTNVRKLEKHFDEKNWNWDDYFKFSFVRNPWDRTISVYKYLLKLKNKSWVREYLKETGSFSEYVKHGRYYPSQADQLNNISDFYIGKFENLQEDFNIVCDKIGITKQQLPHKNPTKHKHYTEYYDDETKSIIAEKYAKDIEYFGYEFGE